MGRSTKQNKITSPELLEKVNPENIRLMEDFITYLKSIQRSDATILSYKNDLEIFFCWCLQKNNNKEFVKVTKRDIISYQNWLINTNGNSPARVRRLKSTLSSLSNYIENVLDDDHPGFKPIIKKVESPINQPVREKTIFTDEQVESILNTLVENKQYEKACCLALAVSSGRRKKELLRYKTSFFKDEYIIYGSLYKSPEKIKTKGRGLGKFIYVYTLSKGFKPYFDLWMEERKKNGVESEWLFYDHEDPAKQINPDTLNSWALTFSRLLGVPFYWHACRHFFTTYLSRMNIPDSVIQSIQNWESAEMCRLYIDTDADEEIGKYFDENGIKSVEKAKLSDL